MPRLVASLGVVVALAVCIGFNTVRYPVVWEAVAMSHQLPQADPSAKPAEAKPAATTSDASHPGYICTDGVCRLASARETSRPPVPARPAASVVTPAAAKPAAAKPAATKPAAAKPAAAKPAADKPAVAKSETSAPQPVMADPQPALGMLVPVARPAASSQAATSQRKATSSAKGGVRRLPSLDQTEAPPTVASEPQAGEQLPIYPTTITR